jgi:hypothetical protein
LFLHLRIYLELLMKEYLPSNNLATAIQGTWWLLSREDFTKEGKKIIDPVLGADPTAILVYAKNYFAAQFMKKDRTSDSINQTVNAAQNNTAAIGGYDAYFGTYSIDENTNMVEHTLIGSINPANIGITVFRKLKVEEDKLTIQLETTYEGEPITRTLIWKKI